MANLAFISDKANRKISGRAPELYLPELEVADDSYLRGHLVPTDPALRTVAAYPELVNARRELLATAMNELLDAYRPSFLDRVQSVAPETGVDTRVEIDAFGTSVEAGDIQCVIRATSEGAVFTDTFPYAALDSLLNDLADGLGAELEFGGEYLALDAETETVALPVGPLSVSGSLIEWRKVLDRELGDLLPLDEMPAVEVGLWAGPRTEVSVLDSD